MPSMIPNGEHKTLAWWNSLYFEAGLIPNLYAPLFGDLNDSCIDCHVWWIEDVERSDLEWGVCQSCGDPLCRRCARKDPYELGLCRVCGAAWGEYDDDDESDVQPDAI